MRIFALLPLLLSGAAFSQSQKLIIGEIATNGQNIAFTHAGQIWTVPATGGAAHRLFKDDVQRGYPCYSPDGKQLAFTHGNGDIYIVPAEGGSAQRLTYHPKFEAVRSWTADGRGIIFSSQRESDNRIELYEMRFDNPLEKRLPFPTAVSAVQFSGGYVYNPWTVSSSIRRRFYRGGTTAPLMFFNPEARKSETWIKPNHNSINPAVAGGKLFFLSDSKASFNLATIDPRTKKIQELTDYRSNGITAMGAGGSLVAYVRDGQLYTYDAAASAVKRLPFTFDLSELGDLDERAPKRASPFQLVQHYGLSTDGKKAVVTVRGDVVIATTEEVPAQAVTTSSNAYERFPALSPDGGSVAYFTDESGEYELHIRKLSDGSVRKIAIEKQPTFYRELKWSPDGLKLSFSDQRLALWVCNLDSGSCAQVDASQHLAQDLYNPSWSPDGRWLAYSKALPTRVRAIYLWDSQGRKTYPVSDPLVQSEFPVFDLSGRYLYFTSSHTARNASAADINWGLYSSMLAQPLTTKGISLAILAKGELAPFFPGSNQVRPDWVPATSHVQVDPEGVGSRIIPLPVPDKDIVGLAAGKAGSLIVQVQAWPDAPLAGNPTWPLYRYELKLPRNLVKISDDSNGMAVSADGSKLLYELGNKWNLVDLEAPKPEPAALHFGNMTLPVDPVQEWKQIYREAWRMMRDTFYDPQHHGRNIAELERHYAEYLPYITRRQDLNNLITMAFGEISISHLQVRGGDSANRSTQATDAGLLGADYEVANGKYRFGKIYNPGPYTSQNAVVRSVLKQPGVDVREGDYLIEVDGTPVNASQNVHAFFENKTRRPLKIKVSSSPQGSNAREYTLILPNGENSLRTANWVAANRAYVDKASGGMLGYVYIGGWDSEGYSLMSQAMSGMSDKQGLILDQRGNGGGITPDAIVDMLRRSPMLGYAYRYGTDFIVPTNRIDGPKVLMIDQGNGSAAETGALMFKALGVGKLVGKRTWGGGVGAALYQRTLIDNGSISIPNRAGHNPFTGEWEIENDGVRPNVEVDLTPESFLEGRDPQLETAVRVALDELKRYKKPVLKRPKMPVHPGG